MFFDGYKNFLKADKIDAAMFSLGLKAASSSDITNDRLYQIVATIHPDHRTEFLEYLMQGEDLQDLHQAFGDTFMSASWAMTYQWRELMRKVFKI